MLSSALLYTRVCAEDCQLVLVRMDLCGWRTHSKCSFSTARRAIGTTILRFCSTQATASTSIWSSAGGSSATPRMWNENLSAAVDVKRGLMFNSLGPVKAA
ncbi:hypothetical protein BLNAU_12788 [Blattamonas nauphoetae]|uniref:Secreted protein n=1 Tax=Blattamonas nauphoetae TaxID=2049346 RepID=A0ABQ9XL92_9EUKA|nr:hypothetical protein BLNAU_12788 [Blattamonas nauphoetae]